MTITQARSILKRLGCKTGTLLTEYGGNQKIAKSDAQGEYLTKILHLAPGIVSGYEVCPDRTDGCYKDCLMWAGIPYLLKVKTRARKARTRFLHLNQVAFNILLAAELYAHVVYCKEKKVHPACRLNGTSDLPWEKKDSLLTYYSMIQFYDYTKSKRRMMAFLRGKMPPNYYLCFSRSENNERACKDILGMGGNVVVVFGKGFPNKFWGHKVVSGDEHDLRFLDPKNSIVGVKAKGRARQDKTSGFVIW